MLVTSRQTRITFYVKICLRGIHWRYLADGMGGLSYGYQAAQIVSHSIADYIASYLHKYDLQELLRKAFDMADKSIRQKCYELRCKMGAAVCVALIGNDSVHYAWQGNVRLYKRDNDMLQLLTTDHIAIGGSTTFIDTMRKWQRF